MATDHAQHWERACLNTNKSYTFDTVRLKRRFSIVSTGIIESFPLTQFSTCSFTKTSRRSQVGQQAYCGILEWRSFRCGSTKIFSGNRWAYHSCSLHLISQSIEDQDIDLKSLRQEIGNKFPGPPQHLLDSRHSAAAVIRWNRQSSIGPVDHDARTLLVLK